MTDFPKTPDTIYLIPDVWDGMPGWSWCDDPAPSVEHDPSEAVEYIRAESLGGGEAAATVAYWNEGGSGKFVTAEGIEKLPCGTKLYTTPQPPAVPEWIPGPPAVGRFAILHIPIQGLLPENNYIYAAVSEDGHNIVDSVGSPTGWEADDVKRHCLIALPTPPQDQEQ